MTAAMAAALAGMARSALDAPGLAGGLSLRAAAFVARQALEAAIEAEVGAPEASMRAQLLCLVDDDPERGGEASQLWWALTRACHQHAYELRPTRAEVGALVGRAAAWIDRAPTTASSG